MGKLPEIAPHTLAKHAILKRYLDAWFPILGNKHRVINYIDGFAGSGEYEGGQIGSPIIALRAANHHMNNGTLCETTIINFIFINNEQRYCEHLRKVIAGESIPDNFRIQTPLGDFAEILSSSLDELEENHQRIAPTFAFVDPFGFSGIPMNIMHRLLDFPKCEVFVNLMIDFINRFVSHPSPEVVQHAEECFGVSHLSDRIKDAADRKSLLLEIYADQLRAKAKFVNRFDMKSRRSLRLYSLFFASKNVVGYKKMKEAFWAVDQNAGGLFSDKDPNGYSQFDLFGAFELQGLLESRFSQQQVDKGIVEDWVVSETAYLPKHLHAQLKDMEKDGIIEVIPIKNVKRKRGTFPRGKVEIRFLK